MSDAGPGTSAAWGVLALVFVDEVLAVWALADTGGHLAGWFGGVLAAGSALALWWTFASPKAPLGGAVTRPLVKVAVFGTAVVGLLWAGHVWAGWTLLVFSVVVNAAAQAPAVRRLTEQTVRSG